MNKNLALQVRTALNLSPTEAGKLLLGYPGGSKSQAYATWRRWETGDRTIPLSTEKYFNLTLKMIDIYGVKLVIGLLQAIK